MADFFKVPKTKTLLWTLCGILGILIVFGLGIVVGYHRAIFTLDFDENYYRNFYGQAGARPFAGAISMGPMTSHGVFGEVIDVGSDTIAVKNTLGGEESIVIASDTPVREMGNTISVEEIVDGDNIAVIGEPNPNGQVEARFIRIFQAPMQP